jgi:hypothetical protein
MAKKRMACFSSFGFGILKVSIKDFLMISLNKFFSSLEHYFFQIIFLSSFKACKWHPHYQY